MKNMKRKNYYQVHKNKKPKVVFEQQHKYVKYMLAMTKRSIEVAKSFKSLVCSMDEFLESIKIKNT
jgi:hypothetical protein